jgi:glycosyltransferase 2 family protein
MIDGPIDHHIPRPARNERMKRASGLVWKVIGLVALVASMWILSRQIRDISIADVVQKLVSLPASSWFGCALAGLVAYTLLGFYDRLALAHIRRKVDPLFVHLCAAATYAFAHVVGASVLSGAVIRYRAYTSKGLSASEVAILVTFCTLTFGLGIVAVLGVILVSQPFIVDRFADELPLDLTSGAGKLMIGFAVLYVVVSLLPLKSTSIRGVTLVYPRPRVTILQIAVASAEIVTAAMIIYLALPEGANPGLVATVGIFVIAFAAALISHSPAGLGVFELVFLIGMPEVPEADLLAALLVFRIFYFLLPFVFSVVMIVAFELRTGYR